MGQTCRYHLKAANDAVEGAIRYLRSSLFVKAGVFRFVDALSVTLTHASGANAQTRVIDLLEKLPPRLRCVEEYPLRPHQPCLGIHPSTVRSAPEAEALALRSGVERGWKARAGFSDMNCQLLRADG